MGNTTGKDRRKKIFGRLQEIPPFTGTVRGRKGIKGGEGRKRKQGKKLGSRGRKYIVTRGKPAKPEEESKGTELGRKIQTRSLVGF